MASTESSPLDACCSLGAGTSSGTQAPAGRERTTCWQRGLLPALSHAPPAIAADPQLSLGLEAGDVKIASGGWHTSACAPNPTCRRMDGRGLATTTWVAYLESKAPRRHPSILPRK